MLGRLSAVITGGGAGRNGTSPTVMRERVLAGRAQVAVGLDVGRCGVRCAVCALDGESCCVLGCGQVD